MTSKAKKTQWLKAKLEITKHRLDENEAYLNDLAEEIGFWADRLNLASRPSRRLRINAKLAYLIDQEKDTKAEIGSDSLYLKDLCETLFRLTGEDFEYQTH